MKILMNHHRGIIEKIFCTSPQVDASPPRGRSSIQMKPSKQGVFDNLDASNAVTEECRESDTYGLGYRHAASHIELVYFGAAGTSPYLDITSISFARSGGPPALTTAATSRKYCITMSGVMMISARAVSEPPLLN